jgi:hypothetical protein
MTRAAVTRTIIGRLMRSRAVMLNQGEFAALERSLLSNYAPANPFDYRLSSHVDLTGHRLLLLLLFFERYVKVRG